MNKQPQQPSNPFGLPFDLPSPVNITINNYNVNINIGLPSVDDMIKTLAVLDEAFPPDYDNPAYKIIKFLEGK